MLGGLRVTGNDLPLLSAGQGGEEMLLMICYQASMKQTYVGAKSISTAGTTRSSSVLGNHLPFSLSIKLGK